MEMLRVNYGHFAYVSLHLRRVRLLFGHFAYWTLRLQDILPTGQLVLLLFGHFAYKAK